MYDLITDPELDDPNGTHPLCFVFYFTFVLQ